MANKKADFKLDDMRKIKKQANVKDCWFDCNEHLFHCLMFDGTEWTSPTGSAQDKWTRIPKKETGDLPPTQQKIHEIMGAMKDLLLYKNQMYGDSAINPEKIFYKGDSTSSILVRLNDKIGRVKANPDDKPRINDICDIIGYCTLLLISMGVTAEDIAKFKD